MFVCTYLSMYVCVVSECDGACDANDMIWCVVKLTINMYACSFDRFSKVLIKGSMPPFMYPQRT